MIKLEKKEREISLASFDACYDQKKKEERGGQENAPSFLRSFFVLNIPRRGGGKKRNDGARVGEASNADSAARLWR